MLVHLRRSIIVSLIVFAICGLAYPFAGTGVSHLLFKDQADGSIAANGSPLIGQQWRSPLWFQGRPPVNRKDPYDPVATGGSNLGPRSSRLARDVSEETAVLARKGIEPTPGLVTSSASGIDPDISPADAYAQVEAVARRRGLPVSQVRQLVTSHIHSAELGFLGSDYVNVLELNEALAKTIMAAPVATGPGLRR